MFDLIMLLSWDWTMLSVTLVIDESPVTAEWWARPRMPSVTSFQHPCLPHHLTALNKSYHHIARVPKQWVPNQFDQPFFYLLVFLHQFPFSWSIITISRYCLCNDIMSVFLSDGTVGSTKQFNNSAHWRYVIVVNKHTTFESDLA